MTTNVVYWNVGEVCSQRGRSGGCPLKSATASYLHRIWNTIDCFSISLRVWYPHLLLKTGRSFKPWDKVNTLLHPNILLLQTHFRVSEVYNIQNRNIPWMGVRKCVSVGCDGDTFLPIKTLFCWVGIRGNEKADSATKSALDLPRLKVGIPLTDFKYNIKQYILFTWQGDWNGAVVNKLHSVKLVFVDYKSSYRKCRTGEVFSCRVHIRHT